MQPELIVVPAMFLFPSAVIIVRMWFRHTEKMASLAPRPGASPELDERIARVEQTVDAIASGCHVANASFGSTVCAERHALFRAVADGAPSVVALVLYPPTARPATPFGACRQPARALGRT